MNDVVKENYIAIVTTLNNIYEETHQPEALGISKALSSKSTISAVYLLNYILPQVAKLSKTLQSEKLDLTVISSLVEATLYTLDDALSPAANWVLELEDMKESLEEAAGVNITTSDIQNFQSRVGNPFVSTLKSNISQVVSVHKTSCQHSVYLIRRRPQVWTPPSINSTVKIL